MDSDDPTFRDRLAEFFTGPLGFLAELGVWGAASVGLAGIIFVYLGGLKDSPKTRETFETWLTYDTVGQAYRGQLRRVLDWIDGALCSRAELALPATDPRRGWSTKLLSYALIFALAYPILSLLIRWTFANDGFVGGLAVLPAHDQAPLRYATLGLIAVSFLFSILAARQTASRPRLAFQLVAAGLLVGFIALGIALDLPAVAVAVAFAVAVTGAVAFAVAFAGAVTFGGAVTLAVAGAGAAAVAVL